MVSDKGKARVQNAADAHSQPDRNPGAAWDFEIEAAAITRSS
jgi:hypothetical protein